MLKSYQDMYDDLQILAINLTYNDTKESVEALISENKYNFPIIFDEDGGLSRMYDFTYIPFIVLVDERGIIRYKGSAPNSIDDLRDLINH
jgi:peroxiredoxin